ncbi:MAG: endolytic transglycosylase MltG [Gemmatimonadota bacterium]
MTPRRAPPALHLFAVALASTLAAGCSDGEATSELVEFTIPAGATFAEVTDTLVARNLVGRPLIFRTYARLRGDDREVRAGSYEVPGDAGWGALLDQLVAGRMVTFPLTIPEGFTLRQIAARITAFAELDSIQVEAELLETGVEEEWEVPGPGLEGYLFPDTYFFAPGVGLESIVGTLVEAYRSFWTPERRVAAEARGLSEREVATLASIVQAEAVLDAEMPMISGVFHNRLRLGIPLQADPTVQYALGERRSRLLYADIDSVADHPYNTYAQAGLPPGPIGAPGRAALEAVLNPADVPYLYFVARPDGTHIFSSTLDQHNNARIQARREWDEIELRDEEGS